MRLRKRKYVEVKCAYCGNKKTTRSDNVKKKNYCNASCSQKDRLRKPEDHPSWKGGRRVTSNGYIEIYMPDHPRARGRYVFEHIVVLEKKIGRPLREEEEVHHKNRIKTDNRPENLQPINSGDHTRLHAPERRRGKMLRCVVCNQEFYRKPSHVERSKCCSRKCVGKYTHLNRKGVSA